MAALTRWSLARPRAALALLALVTVGLGLGLLQLQTQVGYRAFLGADHPSVRGFDAFLERFGGGLPVAIVWSCGPDDPCDDVFDPVSLQMAHALAQSLDATPGVRSVEGPATTPLLVPVPDGLRLARLVDDGRPVRDLQALRARALADPLWVGNLVSSDARVGALVCELASSDSAASVAFFETLGGLLAPLQARGFTFRLVGGPVDFVVAASELERATQKLVPLVALMTGLLLWLFVRSAAAVAVTLATLAIAALWTLGALGWIGWPQNTITQALPPLVLVVGACNAIHLLSRFASELGPEGGADAGRRRGALERAARDIGGPCLVASVTTAGGFLSFGTSALESFARFGMAAAFGVMAGLVLAFSLLPILVSGLPARWLPASSTTASWDHALLRLVDGVARQRIPILVFALAIGVLCAIGATRLRTEATFEDLYGEHSRVVRWVRYVEQHLRAPETLEIELAPPAGTPAHAPAALERVAALQASLADVPGLGRASSVLEPLRRMNRIVHDDDPTFERLGTSVRANAQLLFLLRGDDAHRLDPWITPDHSALRVSVEARKVPESALAALLDRVHELVRELFPGWQTRITGAAPLVHEMAGEIKRTQQRSFLTAFVVVLALTAVFLRSASWALLAMIPTGLPVVVTLGVMGFARVRLDPGTAMVAAVVIGIAIDDTIHVLAQYRRRRRDGAPPDEAIRGAATHVGRALITTSIALALGFSTLWVSPWSSVASFGLVSAIAIIGALAADLVVLPALVLSISRRRAQNGLFEPAERRLHD